MFETFPSLHTKRLDLIEIKQEHLGDIFKLFGDRKVTRFYNIVTLVEEKEAQKLIDWFQHRFTEKSGIRWGIALKGERNIIGTIGFNNFTPHHRANIGFDLRAEFWSQGFMTEALQTVINFGFDNLAINRIEAEVMQGNAASEKVLSKAHFQKEGILREWMYWNGNHYDMTMFSLIKSAFKR